MLATILKGFFLATIVMPITGCGVGSGDRESDSDVSAADPREKHNDALDDVLKARGSEVRVVFLIYDGPRADFAEQKITSYVNNRTTNYEVNRYQTLEQAHRPLSKTDYSVAYEDSDGVVYIFWGASTSTGGVVTE